MTVKPSKRRANDKWDKENMASLGCKVLKAEAEAFKLYCSEQGHTVNTELSQYVRSCISTQTKEEETKE